MDKRNVTRLRGLKDLVCDGVVEGASAIEKVHKATAKRPFSVLKHVPGVAVPAAEVEKIHDAIVGLSYEGVRAVTRLVDSASDKAFDLTEARVGPDAEGPPPSTSEMPKAGEEPSPTVSSNGSPETPET